MMTGTAGRLAGKREAKIDEAGKQFEGITLGGRGIELPCPSAQEQTHGHRDSRTEVR